MQTLFANNGHLSPEGFTPRCWDALQQAREVARLGGWDNLRSPHLFIGVTQKPEASIARWAEFAGLDLVKLGDQLAVIFKQEGSTPLADACPLHREFCSNGFIKLLQDALASAHSKSQRQITQSDIAGVILHDGESVVHQSLQRAGLSCANLATLLVSAQQSEDSAQQPA